MQLFIAAFQGVPDPRAENVRHDLVDLLIIAAKDDALGHHVARRQLVDVAAVAYAATDDVAIGDHSDEPIILANGNRADVEFAHLLRNLSDGRLRADPLCTLVHC